MERTQSGTRVNFDKGSHARGAVKDRLLHHRGCAGIDIVLGKTCLGRSGFTHGFLQRACANAAAVENAGLVEMHMAVDKARKRHLAAQILFRDGFAHDLRCKRCHDPAGDRDIDELIKARHPGIAQNKIGFHGSPFDPDPEKLSLTVWHGCCLVAI